MIILILVAFTVAFTATVMRLLPQAGWVRRSPRLGIAAWYAALLTVVMAAAAIVSELVFPWPGGAERFCVAGSWCLELTGERHGFLAWLVARLVAGSALLAAAAVGARALASTRIIARRRRRHRETLQIFGRRHGRLGVTVIDDARPAAYVAPGRPQRVVVTTGAVDQLQPDELAAVLAHERAHAAGHHQALLDIVHVAARIFPRSALTSTARQQVERLVEMRADEVAAASHQPLHLARALVAMATGGADVSAGLTAATGGDAVERLHRLMQPPRRLQPASRAVVAAAVALLPAVPLALAAACNWWPFLSSYHWDL
uniref:M56 family metallopeptidase n=1 Tax=Paractinoplanes polyasparticus TaxID=2856853 RepID=UPI001C85B2D7|nr:M56 family metallopeptidase [Actinoplanes polyasparticus]